MGVLGDVSVDLLENRVLSMGLLGLRPLIEEVLGLLLYGVEFSPEK